MSNLDCTLSSWHSLTAVFSTGNRWAMEDDQLAVDLPYPLSALQLAVNVMLPWLNQFSYPGYHKAAAVGSVNASLTMLLQNLCHFWISIIWLCNVLYCGLVLRNLLAWICGICVSLNGPIPPLANGTKVSFVALQNWDMMSSNQSVKTATS